MCLNNKYDKPCSRKTGWKLFVKREDGTLRTGVCSANIIEFPEGQWIADPNKMESLGYGSCSYQPGFHIFLSRESARKVKIEESRRGRGSLVLRRVRFKGLIAYGRIHWNFSPPFYTTAVVAKKCKVLPE